MQLRGIRADRSGTGPLFTVFAMFRHPKFLSGSLLLVMLLFVAGGAYAQGTSRHDGLLPASQAFAFKAAVTKPGNIALHWDIAQHYDLYRGRIHAKILTPGVTAGKLDLPPGTHEHLPYLGDVTIYRGTVIGSLPFTASGAVPTTLKVVMIYQGCHTTAPKICYPPVKKTLTLRTAGGNPGATTVPTS